MKAQLAHILAAFVPLLAGGCDESLPPRNDPLAIVQGGFSMSTDLVVIRDGIPLNLGGMLQGWVENTFTEVLQDTQRVLMNVEITLKEDPSQKTHVVADRYDVQEPQYLSGPLLTLEPGKPLHIVRQWSHQTDAGVWYWGFVTMHVQFTPGGVRYLESDPITFEVRASVQGFARVGAAHFGPFEYTLTYRVF